MTTIYIVSHVSVYGEYLFYLKLLYIHNIFHLTDGCPMWCTRAFIHWIKEVFTTFIHTNITITLFFFLFRSSQIVFHTLISIPTEKNIYFASLSHVNVTLMLSNSFSFIKVIPDWIVLLTCTIVSLTLFVLSTSDLTPLVRRKIWI